MAREDVVLATKAGEMGWFGGGKPGVVASAPKAQPWSLFGKPRDVRYEPARKRIPLGLTRQAVPH